MSKNPTPKPGPDHEEEVGILRYRQIKNKTLIKERRSQILEAARDLFAKKGFNLTTIQDICEQSGVNPGSLYDYVKNKDDILRLLFKKMMGERAEERAAIYPAKGIHDTDGLRQYVRTLIHHAWTVNPDIISLAYQETRFLDDQTKKDVIANDHNLIKDIANAIGNAMGGKVEPRRQWVAASMLVFLLGFHPLKGWTLRGMEREVVIDTTVDMFMKALETL